MSDADTRRLMEGIAAMWRTTLGARVRIEAEEWRAFQQNRQLRGHGLFYYAWTGDYPDPLTFLALPRTGGDQNHMQYSSDAYDRAVDEGMRAVDPAVRQAAYQRRWLLNADGVMPIYYYPANRCAMCRAGGKPHGPACLARAVPVTRVATRWALRVVATAGRSAHSAGHRHAGVRDAAHCAGWTF
jgi:ABC-type oligopeptide transport system substrate-binding subunit